MGKNINRFSQVRKILIIILALNWLTALIKGVYGLISKSASITADGMHSFSDGASNIVGLIGIWAASQPVDKDHPYGHRKYETLAALGITALLAIVCFEIIKDAVQRFFNPVFQEVSVFSFLIMAVALIINIAVMRYEYRKGKELNSEILISDSLHTKSDVLVSLSVIATLAAVKLGFPFLDFITAIAIAAFIAHTAFRIFKENSEILCDRLAVSADKIRQIVLAVEGVKSCHNIRTRGRCDDIFLDLHICIRSDMSIREGHDLSHIIIDRLKNKIPGISDVVVHIEPEEDRHIRKGEF
jgi:cation diffusion facilitator family transporter